MHPVEIQLGSKMIDVSDTDYYELHSYYHYDDVGRNESVRIGDPIEAQ